jgi:hypothetical protein
MNDVNVGVQVPQTTQNATPSTNLNQNGSNQVQTQGLSGNPIATPSGEEAVVGSGFDAGLAIIAMIFILVAIILFILIFRDQLMRKLRKFLNK